MTRYYYNGQIKEDENGRTCNMNGIKIKGDKILVENLKKDHLVDVDVY
jgi:hypothetical protein